MILRWSLGDLRKMRKTVLVLIETHGSVYTTHLESTGSPSHATPVALLWTTCCRIKKYIGAYFSNACHILATSLSVEPVDIRASLHLDNLFLLSIVICVLQRKMFKYKICE
jgi:hypothetical protein